MTDTKENENRPANSYVNSMLNLNDIHEAIWEMNRKGHNLPTLCSLYALLTHTQRNLEPG